MTRSDAILMLLNEQDTPRDLPLFGTGEKEKSGQVSKGGGRQTRQYKTMRREDPEPQEYQFRTGTLKEINPANAEELKKLDKEMRRATGTDREETIFYKMILGGKKDKSGRPLSWKIARQHAQEFNQKEWDHKVLSVGTHDDVQQSLEMEIRSHTGTGFRGVTFERTESKVHRRVEINDFVRKLYNLLDKTHYPFKGENGKKLFTYFLIVQNVDKMIPFPLPYADYVYDKIDAMEAKALEMKRIGDKDYKHYNPYNTHTASPMMRGGLGVPNAQKNYKKVIEYLLSKITFEHDLAVDVKP